jgi:hypothetical protein
MQHQHAAVASAGSKSGGERKSPKPQTWQTIGTKFDEDFCRLLFCSF